MYDRGKSQTQPPDYMLKSLLRPLRQKLFPQPAAPVPGETVELSPADEAIAQRCRPYTMTSPERMASLLDSVEYIVKRNLPGAFAECGVWRGGSVLAMALKLMDLGVTDRDIYLYDTFEGMTAPTEHDTSPFHAPASEDWEAAKKSGDKIYDGLFNAEIFNESLVRDVLLKSGYPAERFHFVRGPVEQTIPGTLPGELALLRLLTSARAVGSGALHGAAAWSIAEEWRSRGVAVEAEPTGVDDLLQAWAGMLDIRGRLWTDAYLAAFAVAGGYRLVSFDSAFHRFPHLHWLHLA